MLIKYLRGGKNMPYNQQSYATNIQGEKKKQKNEIR